ncbi:MAG: hypothetical protein NC225_00945 [Clostridium sp.]|nr:hypothetical protein [Clostridium sp.]MCM1398027.1 hypothetical protein [Clostridium sp.]MCM1459337.1 hypothetical protein [Bacteroides sp.]
MKFLYKLESKYGKYAIKNLALYIAVVFALSYFFELLLPDVYVKLVFSPYQIFVEHEWWRIFTWIFTTPGDFDFFTLIMLFFYYSIGQQIEAVIGTFMFNLYIFGGMFFTTVGITVSSAISYYAVSDTNSLYSFLFSEIAGYYLTYFMTISIFLGFAFIYADSTLMLWFIIPFKASWLAIIDLMFLAYYFITLDNLVCRVAIIASVLNFVIFYIINKKYSLKYQHVRHMPSRKLKRKRSKGNGDTGEKVIPLNITKHKCAVCQRTEKDDEMLEFRFCSKCNGNYEYCSEHLYTHEHIK